MELIKISNSNVGGEVQQTVNARELHEFLGNKDKFATWVRSRIEQFDFVENVDYVTFSENSEKGRPRVEFALSLDMAKELSMVERTEKGKQARIYFIECERRAKDPVAALSDPVVMRGLLLNYTEKVIELQQAVQTQALQIEHNKPKVETFDELMSANGDYTINSAAKILGLGQNHLFQILRREYVLMGLLSGKSSTKWNVPYQKYIDKGYFKAITTPVKKGSFVTKHTQTYVTPAGLHWLRIKLQEWNEESYLEAA